MSADFIPLAPNFWVAPQISVDDLDAAKALGVSLVINNRPDGEEFGQPNGAEIEKGAIALGLTYVSIPVGPMGVSPADLDAFDAALSSNRGGVLAFCRSGTRSTIVRAFAEARRGRPVDEVIGEAAEAGYNIAGQRRMLEAARGK
ncbi:MAG: TIGR01244 family sulfur transferase [Parvularculaceae bacterium]|nr:TIGR01244 family sulfur transferase [Parvularculaceae bacterium]